MIDYAQDDLTKFLNQGPTCGLEPEDELAYIILYEFGLCD
jgi:hypothetical protein